MGEEIEGNAVALVREFRVHDASETLLRDWAEHAGAAAGEGLHPFHAPGYDALLDRIRDHEREGREENARAACPGAGGARTAGPRGPRGAQAHRAARRLPGEARRAAGAGGAKALFPGSRSSSSGGGMRAGTARRSAPWGADASSSGTIATRTTWRRSAAGRRSSARSSASSAPPSSTTCRRGSWRRARPWTTASGRPAGTASSCRSTREPAT